MKGLKWSKIIDTIKSNKKDIKDIMLFVLFWVVFITVLYFYKNH